MRTISSCREGGVGPFRRFKRAFKKAAKCRGHFGAAKDKRIIPQTGQGARQTIIGVGMNGPLVKCRVDVNSESQQSSKIKAWPLTLIVPV
jgi:hypothetical protein